MLTRTMNRPRNAQQMSNAEAHTHWHVYEVTEVLQKVDTTMQGLTEAEAHRRLVAYGPNELKEQDTKKPWKIYVEQFTSIMVIILIVAALISAFLGKWLESGAIMTSVFLFTLLGFLQEYRAERAIAALKKLSVPNVRVRRGGQVREISARDVVPGDILVIEAGNLIPADVRIIESINLQVQEAALTGESEPVHKEPHRMEAVDAPPGDRHNMGYMGTVVTYGRGTAVVVATGMRTELGKVATLIQGVRSEKTLLQQRLHNVGKLLAVTGVTAAIAIMLIGLLVGESIDEMLLTAISVAVAVIPEGLPAVITFTLALGAQRMLKRNALIRRMTAVEALGSVTVICSDKTGTLTENRMTVTVIDMVGHRLDLHERMRHHVPVLNPQDFHPEALPAQPTAINTLLAGGALCNDAILQEGAETGAFQTIGDPTEGALLIAAAQAGLLKDRLQHVLPRVAEIPFDSDRKRMTTVHQLPASHHVDDGAQHDQDVFLEHLLEMVDAPYVAITKGAVDGLLDLASHVWVDEQAMPINAELRYRIQAANEELAQNGMRVLGIAFRPLQSAHVHETTESQLIFVGMVGMIDPPRPEVRMAVQTCKTAGIRPVMITGDHPLTASYIARDLGIARTATVLTGQELDRLSDQELQAMIERVSVFARVTPEHKLRIVEAFQKQGHVVAMTGDGVNDAPALKKADIGVAMGIAGSDVSKEAAGMVLRDDNFATIVAAVEEGRVIYDNLRRFVKFAVAGNVGKVMIMLLWPLLLFIFNLPMSAAVALLPLQLLWLNLIIDGLLGLSMATEPAEKDTMRRPPHSPAAGLLTSDGMQVHVAWVGMLIGVLSLGVGLWYYSHGMAEWQTMIFTTLAFLQVFHAIASRSRYASVFRIGLFSNRLLVFIVGLIVSLHIAVLYVPLLQETFLQLQPLSLAHFLTCVGLGSVVFVAIEIEKLILRQRKATRTLRVAKGLTES